MALSAGALPHDHHEAAIMQLREAIPPPETELPAQASSSSRRPRPPLRGSVADVVAGVHLPAKPCRA
eukprot:3112855-Prorocentrum_lima.AAC.1